jgi:hypothetical protein
MYIYLIGWFGERWASASDCITCDYYAAPQPHLASTINRANLFYR